MASVNGVEDMLWANVNKDGTTDAVASPDNAKKSTRGDSVLGKDAFLNLLVAQMKYQDPLNPSSDTEWIAQMATFSTLEEMQNMNTTLGNSQALSLVGKTVIVKADDNLVGGKVDYVLMQAGKAYLSINESLYSIDDLDTVADDDYLLQLKEAGLIKGDIALSDTQQILNAMGVMNQTISGVGTSVDKAAATMTKAASSIEDAAEEIKATIGSLESPTGSGSTEAGKTDEAKPEGTDKAEEPTDETAKTDETAETGTEAGDETADKTEESAE